MMGSGKKFKNSPPKRKKNMNQSWKDLWCVTVPMMYLVVGMENVQGRNRIWDKNVAPGGWR